MSKITEAIEAMNIGFGDGKRSTLSDVVDKLVLASLERGDVKTANWILEAVPCEKAFETKDHKGLDKIVEQNRERVQQFELGKTMIKNKFE